MLRFTDLEPPTSNAHIKWKWVFICCRFSFFDVNLALEGFLPWTRLKTLLTHRSMYFDHTRPFVAALRFQQLFCDYFVHYYCNWHKWQLSYKNKTQIVWNRIILEVSLVGCCLVSQTKALKGSQFCLVYTETKQSSARRVPAEWKL